MIDIFGEQYNYEIIRHKDEKSSVVPDVYGLNDGENEEDRLERFYPDDLEKLLYTIRSITKSSMSKLGETSTSDKIAVKGSSFSSFSNKSSFGVKKAVNNKQNT
jgi:hypothetical protein